jgi:hypothetical protein
MVAFLSVSVNHLKSSGTRTSAGNDDSWILMAILSWHEEFHAITCNP